MLYSFICPCFLYERYLAFKENEISKIGEFIEILTNSVQVKRYVLGESRLY